MLFGGILRAFPSVLLSYLSFPLSFTVHHLSALVPGLFYCFRSNNTINKSFRMCMREEQMFGIFHPAFISLLTLQDRKIKKVDSFFPASPYLRLMSEGWGTHGDPIISIERAKTTGSGSATRNVSFCCIIHRKHLHGDKSCSKALRNFEGQPKSHFSSSPFPPLSSPRAHISDDPFRKPIFRLTRFRQLRRKKIRRPFYHEI